MKSFLNVELRRRGQHYWTANLFVFGEEMKIEQSFQLQQKERIVPDHQQMWSGGREKRDEVDFFCNNETLKIDGGLPFVTEPIVTSYNVPSQGSEKCTMGGEDERELIEKGTFQKGKRQG